MQSWAAPGRSGTKLGTSQSAVQPTVPSTHGCCHAVLRDSQAVCQEVTCHGWEGMGTPLSLRLRGHAVLSCTDWREYDGRAPRRRGQAEALDHLLGQVKTVHQHCICHGEHTAQRCREAGVGDPAKSPRVVASSRGWGGTRSRSVPWMGIAGREFGQ